MGGDLPTSIDTGHAGDSWAGDSWAIQLGAFADPMTGDHALTQARAAAPRLLISASHRIIPVIDTRGQPLYRARFTGLTDQTASAACARLIAADQTCLTIAPMN